MKRIFITFLFCILFLDVSNIYASMAMPSPSCRVIVEIAETEVTYKKYSDFAVEEANLSSPYANDGMELRILRVDKEAYEDSAWGEKDYCQTTYEIGKSFIVSSLGEDYKEETVLQGIISYGGDERSMGYNFKFNFVVSPKNPTEGISPLESICTSYSNGCNTCMATNGFLTACTRDMCVNLEPEGCLEYTYKEISREKIDKQKLDFQKKIGVKIKNVNEDTLKIILTKIEELIVKYQSKPEFIIKLIALEELIEEESNRRVQK